MYAPFFSWIELEAVSAGMSGGVAWTEMVAGRWIVSSLSWNCVRVRVINKRMFNNSGRWGV